MQLDLTGMKKVGPIAEGLYAAKLLEEPTIENTQWGKRYIWQFELIMAQPGNEGDVGRRITYRTSFDADDDPKKDTRWRTVRTIEALGVPLTYGKAVAIPPLAGRKCGVVVANKDGDDGRTWSNITAVMTTDKFANELRKLKEDAARRDTLSNYFDGDNDDDA